ncbi:MAG: endonuclease/exonuclease/phosphatase family protein, partial [Clostridia bacterium]|nr:endonuclease/exonuclease/phosphatase family protein [Clostridia bacterium]
MKKLITFLSILVLLMGLCAPVGATIPVYDQIKAEPITGDTHDIAVMSFNILADNSGTAHFAKPTERLYRVLTIIEEYDPDVVGIQEGSAAKLVDETRSWDVALLQDMKKLGYDGVSFTDESGLATTTGRGTMFFYKRNRFTFDKNKQDHGWLSLDTQGTYNGVTAKNGQNRALQWIELIDTAHHNQPVYFFNTHFAINVSKDISGKKITDSTIISKITRDIRTQQAVKVATAIKEKAGNQPYFAMGDYNSSLSTSYTSESNYITPQETGYNQLAALQEVDANITDAALVAHNTINTEIYKMIDHIFFNKACQTVKEFITVVDHVDGRNPSDHYPIIAYANYRTAFSAAPKGYDAFTGRVEQTVTGTSATLPFTPVDKDYTVEVPELTLSRYQNDFQIKVYYKDKLFDTMDARLYRTDAPLPVVSALGAAACYFAKGEYRVGVTSDTYALNLSVIGGQLYEDAAATKVASGNLQNIASGVTKFYVKTTATGEILPLLVCKETAQPAPQTLYIEDQLAGGKGVFVSGDDVVLVQTGTNAFTQPEDAVTIANGKAGYTLRFAPGDYEGNVTYFEKNVTVLGPNADVEASLRQNEGEWLPNPARGEEAVIHGNLIVNRQSEFTIKGMYFTGHVKQASLCMYDNRSADEYTRVCIENNIFSGSTVRSNGAAVFFNTATQKSGVIRGNAFLGTANKVNYADSNDCHYYRGIFGRNINGLVIENNRFYGIKTTLWLTPEISNGDTTTHGHGNYTVQNNRFEYCLSMENAVRNVNESTAVDIKLLQNDFIRCGKSEAALRINFSETNMPMDLTGSLVTIEGNRFYNCMYAVSFVGSSKTANVADAAVKLKYNRFVYPTDHDEQITCLKNTFRLAFNGNPQRTTVVLPEDTRWDFSHNYFESKYLVKGDKYADGANNCTVPDVNDPTYFIYNQNSAGVPALQLERSLYMPYYSDYEMTTLVCEHIWETEYRVDMAPGCATAGSKSIHCKKCDVSDPASVTAIPATGEHTADDELVVDTAPTCGVAGIGHSVCEVCGTTIEEGLAIPATGEHVAANELVVDTAPTCGVAGVGHSVCGTCGITMETGLAIPATGNHTWDNG